MHARLLVLVASVAMACNHGSILSPSANSNAAPRVTAYVLLGMSDDARRLGAHGMSGAGSPCANCWNICLAQPADTRCPENCNGVCAEPATAAPSNACDTALDACAAYSRCVERECSPGVEFDTERFDAAKAAKDCLWEVLEDPGDATECRAAEAACWALPACTHSRGAVGRPIDGSGRRRAHEALTRRVHPKRKRRRTVKIAKLQGPFGPFYADAPKVQAAVSRAERLATLLEETRAREADDLGAAWLIGRAEEMATFVDLILERWRFEGLDAENASVRIGAYLDAVQEGLEIHFGRTRSCSDEALITTAIPDPPSSRLAHALGSGVSEPRGRRTDANDVTAIDVDPTELVAFTPPPPTPTSPL